MPSAETSGDAKQAYPIMPVGYRLYFWLLIIDVGFLTGWVWARGIAEYKILRSGAYVPLDDLARFFIAYHIILLLWSIVAYSMQLAWRILGSFVLYPVCFTICVLLLNVVAATLAVIAK